MKTLLLLFALTSSVNAAITLLGSAYATYSTSNNGVVLNTTGATLLTMSITCDNGYPNAPNTWPDTFGNVWTLAIQGGFRPGLVAYVANPITGASHQVGAYPNTANHGCGAAFFAWTGTAGTGVLDQANNGGSGT